MIALLELASGIKLQRRSGRNHSASKRELDVARDFKLLKRQKLQPQLDCSAAAAAEEEEEEAELEALQPEAEAELEGEPEAGTQPEDGSAAAAEAEAEPEASPSDWRLEEPRPSLSAAPGESEVRHALETVGRILMDLAED